MPVDPAPASSGAVIGFVPLWSSGTLFGSLALRFGPPFAALAAVPLLGEGPRPRTVAIRLLMTERR